MKKLRTFLRGARGFGKFSWLATRAALDYVFNVWMRGRSCSVSERAAWLHRWSKRMVAGLGIAVAHRGNPPAAGMLTSNHLSYLDIIVLGAAQPMAFVAKSEVRGWPVLGWLAQCGGTLFVRRERKSDVARIQNAFATVVNEGVVLGLFPEGTSSDGQKVLPFHSSLLEPAAAANWPVSPAWIGYTLRDGSVEDEVCYWRNMTFLPHFLRLLTKEKIEATVVFGEAAPAGLDRKQMALHLHRAVCELAGQFRDVEAQSDEKWLFFSGTELLTPPLGRPVLRQS